MMKQKAETTNKVTSFLQELAGKKIAVCGIGHNNTPVVLQLLEHGALVTACDKRTREQLGETADQLEQAGAQFCLGEAYLDHLEGMDLILRTPGMKPYLPAFEAVRAQRIPVSSEMELFFDLCPAPIYAVTGSDGKTTTTSIIAGMLEKSGRRVFLGGNIGRPLLPEIEKIRPEDAAVVELSSFQLTMMTCRPHAAVITNVAPNHLDWHTDMQEYIDAKRNLIATQTSSQRAVLNADNAVTAGFAGETQAQVFRFSRQARQIPGAWAEDGMLYAAGEDGIPAAVMPVDEIKLPGKHNLENVLAATAALWGEVDASVMADFARGFGGVAHRCELVRTLDGVRWYNDSIGSSPSRTIAGLKAFGSRVVLIAGGYDKHIPYDPLGPVAAETVTAAILMGDTADAIEKAIRACSDLPILRVKNMEEAVHAARQVAQEGDIVCLSPASASFDQYKNFEERGNHFKALVNAL